MKLQLARAFRFPWPEGLSDDESEALTLEADNARPLWLHGVQSIQFLYVVTIQFRSREHAKVAHELTGWPYWSDMSNVLEATYSRKDGYDAFPALVIGDKAYCDFFLTES